MQSHGPGTVEAPINRGLARAQSVAQGLQRPCSRFPPVGATASTRKSFNRDAAASHRSLPCDGAARCTSRALRQRGWQWCPHVSWGPGRLHHKCKI